MLKVVCSGPNEYTLSKCVCACVCTAVDIVRCSVVVSAAAARRRVCPAVFLVSAASFRSAFSRPTHVHRAAAAHPAVTATAHHRFHRFRRRLGRVHVCAVLDSELGHHQ